MQPVRIGMNPTLVLILLLLAVPLQLFLNHYLQQNYSTSSTAVSKAESEVLEADGVMDGLSEARMEALERLSTSALYVKDQFGSAFRYYSSWKNLKELFIIPRKPQEKRGVHIGTFKTENGNTVQIFTSSSSSSSKKQTAKTKTAKTTTLKPKKPPRIEKEPPSSKAKEVEEYLMKEVYFAQSKEPRNSRPSSVHFKIGQVVRHKMDSYYGVIIGWDAVAKAPDWWLDRFYGKKRKDVIQTPHYHILVDSHFDASGTPYHYIPGEDLEVVSNVQVSAPEVSKFFEGYRDRKHIPRPWLKERYPLG